MDSPGLGLSLLGLLAVAALVLTNAYFVAIEFALVAVRRTQVKLWVREGRRGALSAARTIGNLDDAIAATQLGITVASIGLGWVGEPTIASLVEPPLAAVGIGSAVAVHSVAVAISFSLITFVHVVVGELAPKAIALDRPGEVALAFARPLLIFARIFRGVLRVMNGAGNGLVGLIGVKPAGEAQSVHTPQELDMLVSESRAAGKIRPYAGRILGNVFRITKTRVRDIMVPREDVLAVDWNADPDALLDRLREEGYTRIPVYRGDLDHVVGILHTKDLFHIYAKQHVVVLADATRPTVEMHPDLPVVDALRRFRSGRRHLALVREPGGPLLGICTIEDVLEEIVGEIEDEHDEPTPAASE